MLELRDDLALALETPDQLLGHTGVNDLEGDLLREVVLADRQDDGSHPSRADDGLDPVRADPLAGAQTFPIGFVLWKARHQQQRTLGPGRPVVFVRKEGLDLLAYRLIVAAGAPDKRLPLIQRKLQGILEDCLDLFEPVRFRHGRSASFGSAS